MRSYNGRTYRERADHRAARKAQIAEEMAKLAATAGRLSAIIAAIETAFQAESGKLFDRIVQSWKMAHLFVMGNGSTYEKVRTAYTGIDFEALPFRFQGAIKDADGKYTAAYVDYFDKKQQRPHAEKYFNASKEGFICIHNLRDMDKLITHAERDATAILAANKVKLLAGIAKYMQSYETATVEHYMVHQGAKGFEGQFVLLTDKGKVLFTCKAITAQGAIVSFHWRYLIHVKQMF